MSSTSPGKIILDVVCGSLSAKLCVTDLYNGSSRCVHLDSEILTSCEFERCGRASTRNWKKSIRFKGKPLSEFLELYTSSEGRKCFRFVSSSNEASVENVSATTIDTSPVVSLPCAAFASSSNSFNSVSDVDADKAAC